MVARLLLVLLLGCACFTQAAHADPQPWMKRNDPDTLGVSVEVQVLKECASFDIDDVVRGVLIRARLKPVEFTQTPDLWLRVILQCYPPREQRYLYILKIDFGTYKGASLRYYPDDYGSGSFDAADAESIERAVHDGVERAITDYLEAQTKF
jgi:hypothetical protein